MSNIKKNFFNPGGNNKSNAILPTDKNNTMFDPNNGKKLPIRAISSFNSKNVVVETNFYKKNGKPVKPNVGSMDRLLRLKAKAMSK